MEEDDWVVDCLIGYLLSPLWKNPVDDFIDQHCVVFDQPEGDDPSYVEIHSDYQSMVEGLMNEFTTDVGITWEQLSDACTKSGNLSRQHRALLQPLLASEKHDIFKKMMHHRNVVLERQALQMLQRELGQQQSGPEQQQRTGTGSQQRSADSLQAVRAAREEEMIQRALELSKRDFEKRQHEEDEEMERLVELAKQESLKTLHSLPTEETLGEPVIPDRENSHQKESDDLPSLVADKALIGGKEVASSAGSGETDVTGGEAAELWLQSARLEAKEPSSSGAPVTQIPEDPVEREKYLNYQRKRLLESKKKARANELKVFKASGNKPFASRSTWRPVDTSSKLQPTATYRKLPDDKKESNDDAGNGKGSSAKKTGVLCSAIAKKVMEDATDL